MLGVDLSPGTEVTVYYRVAMLTVVLLVGWRVRKRYHWPVGAAVFFGIANQAFLYAGDLFLSGVFGVLFVGMVSWVMVDYMRNDAGALRHLIGKKEAAWSKERHDLLNDVASLQARLYVVEHPGLGSASDDK